MGVSEFHSREARGDVVGRERELAALRDILDDAGPRVAHVYGEAGIGKTALVDALSRVAEHSGAECLFLDCRQIEPTGEAFVRDLAGVLARSGDDLDALVRTLEKRDNRVVIILDNFEVLQLLDSWLRLTLLPALPHNVRVVLAGRHRPSVGWHARARDQETLTLPLKPLTTMAAETLFSSLTGDSGSSRSVVRRLHGHPLAVRLAAETLRYSPGMQLPEASLQEVMEALTGVYLEDVHDPYTRRLLEGAAVVRRINVPLLHAMFPDDDPEEAYARLRQLHFTETFPDGISLHDTVKDALVHTLRARDPARYVTLRQRAWLALVEQAKTAPRSQLWRFTADILYLIENPVVREAFFPTGTRELVVEQARPDDDEAIRELIAMHEPPAAADALSAWWGRVPEAFIVARDAEGHCRGVCCRFDPDAVARTDLEADPVTREWIHHLDDNPMPPGARSLFIRRWLDRDAGERTGDAQAAIWLDLKRTYMEMRPALRRVYMTLCDLTPYAAVAETLGIRPLADRTVPMEEEEYVTALLDFGEGSVDGWLAGLAAAELGVTNGPDFLDCAARELVLNGQRTPLTPLEYGVLSYLIDRPSEAVSRDQLLGEVWNTRYTGWSNKVDAVVAALRRKLGERADCIETVTGVGYRYRERDFENP